MYRSEVTLEVVDGTPYFTARLDDASDPTRARVFRLPYLAHKTLVEASSGVVVGHTFLVKVSEYEEDATGEEVTVKGATYSIYRIEKHEVVKYNFDVADVLNNWDFAYRYFVDEYGCGAQANVKLAGIERTLSSTDTFR